jgi:hypothetical protein
MNFFAPKAASERRSIDYLIETDRQHGLAFQATDEIRIEEIRREGGHCNAALIPPGIEFSAFELWEDDRPLGPGETLHDEIRELGGGRYHIGPRWVYFSTSDGSDAQRNQRIYTLRRKGRLVETAA